MASVIPLPERSGGNLGEWAYRVLLDEILFHDLRPGAPLQETELAERLGLSRTPVREALRRLVVEGFVTAVPYKGFSVATIDVTDLGALNEMRLALEPLAARRAVESATPVERKQAGVLLEEMVSGPARPRKATAAKRSNREFLDLDRRIHTHIYICTHNRYMIEALGRYLNYSHRIWSLVIDRAPEFSAAVEQHRALLEAVRDDNPDQAEENMREHIAGYAYVLQALVMNQA